MGAILINPGAPHTDASGTPHTLVQGGGSRLGDIRGAIQSGAHGDQRPEPCFLTWSAYSFAACSSEKNIQACEDTKMEPLIALPPRTSTRTEQAFYAERADV